MENFETGKGGQTVGQYKSELAAKRAANKELNPVIARFLDNSYDWFPAGHPIGHFDATKQFVKDDCEIVARFSFGDWKSV
jgi:hypothetical protein